MQHSQAQESQTFTIEAIDDVSHQHWNTFIASQPLGSFYHLYEWKALNERVLGHRTEYLAAKDRFGAIQGALPLTMVQSRLFGRIMCSVPFLNYGGPVAAEANVSSRLVNYATDLARALEASYLELRCASPLDTNLPASLKKVSLTVPLPSDPETLWRSFSSKHRTNIRRAQRRGLEVRSGRLELFDAFYSVLQKSWRDLGTPLYSPGYFKAILAAFGERTRLFVCSIGDEPISVAMNGYFNGTVEGMWAGNTQRSRDLEANYVLYMEMLRDACIGGFKRFHLGRSTLDSAGAQFKKKWNAETTQLYWYCYRPDGGPMPDLSVDNPRFQMAIRAWRMLPVWATSMIGPRIARLIP